MQSILPRAAPTMLGNIEKICWHTQALCCPSLGGTEYGLQHAATSAAMDAYYRDHSDHKLALVVTDSACMRRFWQCSLYLWLLKIQLGRWRPDGRQRQTSSFCGSMTSSVLTRGPSSSRPSGGPVEMQASLCMLSLLHLLWWAELAL